MRGFLTYSYFGLLLFVLGLFPLGLHADWIRLALSVVLIPGVMATLFD